MAIRAGFSKAAAMRIVVPVTAGALRRRIAVPVPCRVTTRACHADVAAFQVEVRHRVIERLPVQPDDVGVPAFVFGVTALAFQFARRLVASMKAEPLLEVLRKLFMAVQTQTPLFGFAEWLVTAAALVFILRVFLDYFARHEDALQGCRLSDRRHGQRDRNDEGQQASAPLPHLRGILDGQYACTTRTWMSPVNASTTTTGR